MALQPHLPLGLGGDVALHGAVLAVEVAPRGLEAAYRARVQVHVRAVPHRPSRDSPLEDTTGIYWYLHV